MRTTRMTERIEFWKTSYSKDENNVPVNGKSKCVYSCWAELLNTPIREFRNPTTKVGYRRESPNFAIRFNVHQPIDSTWIVVWRDKDYEITGVDEDYDKRDITKIECKAVK